MSQIIHRNLRVDPPIAAAGRGIFLYDSAGREIIDGSGGAAVACLGHGHPKIIAAMKEQIDKICYAHTSLFSCDSAERLADQMVGHAPGGLTHGHPKCRLGGMKPAPASEWC